MGGEGSAHLALVELNRLHLADHLKVLGPKCLDLIHQKLILLLQLPEFKLGMIEISLKQVCLRLVVRKFLVLFVT